MTIDRIISLVLVLLWFGAYVVYSLTGDRPFMWPSLLGPTMIGGVILALIWYGEELGDFTGPIMKGGYVSQSSPGWMVKGFGWLLLAFVIGSSIHGLINK